LEILIEWGQAGWVGENAAFDFRGH
jgi:hypothetical protein